MFVLYSCESVTKKKGEKGLCCEGAILNTASNVLCSPSENGDKLMSIWAAGDVPVDRPDHMFPSRVLCQRSGWQVEIETCFKRSPNAADTISRMTARQNPESHDTQRSERLTQQDQICGKRQRLHPSARLLLDSTLNH